MVFYQHMRLHFENHGHEEVLKFLEAKYERNYKLWKEGKWLPTPIVLKKMKKRNFQFPTNQRTVPSKTKMEMIKISKPNLDFLKVPLKENEPLANYRKSKRASVKVTVNKQLQMDMAAKSLETQTLQKQLTEKIEELADKISQNEDLKLDLAQKSEQYNQSEKGIKLLEKTIETLQSNTSKLEDSVRRSVKNLSEKSCQNDEANFTIKQLEKSIKTLNCKTEGLKMDYKQKMDQYNQSEISMNATIKNLQSKVSKLEQSIETMKKEYEEVTKNKI